MPHYDNTVTLGSLIMFGALLATMWKMHIDNRDRFDKALRSQAITGHKVHMMWKWFCVNIVGQEPPEDEEEEA